MLKKINNKVRDGDTIAVWFSCGAASAVAAKKTIEMFGDRCKIRILNNPIKEEHHDNKRFLRDVERWLEVEIESVTTENFPSASINDVFREKKAMSFVHGAPCTLNLKKLARTQWEMSNNFDWFVLGFTSEEHHRHTSFIESSMRFDLLPVLIANDLNKADCFNIILDADIKLPEMYKLGYPNANCIGCVKASSPTYWNHVRRLHPEVFKDRASLSRELGCKLVKVKGVRIFLDELDPNLTTRSMKNQAAIECGIFCEKD